MDVPRADEITIPPLGNFLPSLGYDSAKTEAVPFPKDMCIPGGKEDSFSFWYAKKDFPAKVEGPTSIITEEVPFPVTIRLFMTIKNRSF